MTSQTWSEIAPTCLSDRAGSEFAVALVERLESARVIESRAGDLAVVTQLPVIQACQELEIRLDDALSAGALVAFVVVRGSGSPASVLHELAAMCTCIALLPDESQQAGDMEACGEIRQSIHTDTPQTLRVLRSRSDAGLLRRDAPLDRAEHEGHLDARADWFQKRSGR